MRYKVIFKSGNTLFINEERYRHIFENKTIDIQKFLNEDFPYINIAEVEYILPENIIDNAGSGVLTPPTPNELKRRAEEERQKKLNNPQALIRGIQGNKVDDE